MDVEKFIERIENQYKINFKTLPHWKELIRKLNFVTTFCDSKVAEVKNRESLIINRLYIENARQSPFELTDKLSRTAEVWQKIQWTSRQVYKNKKFQENEGPVPSFETSSKSGTTDSTLSRVEASSEDAVVENFDRNIEKEDILRNAPTNINPNLHKLLSQLVLPYSDLSYHSIPSVELLEKIESSEKICQKLDTQLIKCSPKELIIIGESHDQQTIEFSLQNISNYSCSVIFKNKNNCKVFKKARVFPYLTVKLCPGVPAVFRFVFKLIQTKVDFSTYIFFKVQYKNPKRNYVTKLCIPVSSQFVKPICIEMSKVVYIPPTYVWNLNLKSNCPRGILKIENKDSVEYEIRLFKNNKELTEGTSFKSIDAIAPDTESIIYRNEDNETINEMGSWSSKSSMDNEIEDDTEDNFIISLLKDVIDTALNIFILDITNLHLPPNCKRNITVYFSKSEHTGYHQNYYSAEIRNVDTYEIIETRTVKVFAEILPHPLILTPTILDMADSPIIHGVCTDHFTITNNHKVYSTRVKIETLNIAKKLISITPMSDIILPRSSVKFHVRICSSEYNFEKKSEDMVHFTLKIIATGEKTIYEHMPPIYYEIIAPCAYEFNKICSVNYQDIPLNL